MNLQKPFVAIWGAGLFTSRVQTMRIRSCLTNDLAHELFWRLEQLTRLDVLKLQPICEQTHLSLSSWVQRLEAKVMRELVVEDGLRADGRGLTDVRPISSSCGLLPRTHGSTLFTRGETQAIAVTTLGKLTAHRSLVFSIQESWLHACFNMSRPHCQPRRIHHWTYLRCCVVQLL